ncbi:hypothetical protein KR093_006498 [Drosophila rubida]|uniref:Sas10 C-terminal domain-containing protein n=1 Tax=Drosophila rubida TaxID=30044 RepID=A0AAD4KDN8_9MUSC|nr:hypothetical protein KR093_006498 [Drosophila rubida]
MDSEVDDYEPTDSEEEYNEEEREILQDYRKERQKRADKKRNQKQSVLAFSESDEDDDEEDDEYAAQQTQRGKGKKTKRKPTAEADDDEDDVAQLMRDSDIEGADDDDDLPDTMDWGSNKKTYYNTDFVDQDYSSYNAQEEDMAKAEEEEAKKIQLRLAKQLNEADFQLDDEDTTPSKSQNQASKKLSKKQSMEMIKVTTDLAGLGKRERLQLLQKDSPEFLGIIQEFKLQLQAIQKLTAPVLNYVRNHQVPVVPALQFAQLYQNVLLSYCSNVTYYLLLKAKRSNVKYHPVVKRLVQLKQLREQLAERYVEYIEPQLEALLERIQDGDAFTVLDVAQRKAKLQILNKFDEQHEATIKNEEEDAAATDDDERELAAALDREEGEEEAVEDDELERRGITYQMAKNKGLTPHRKKELRNPRVKHRGKYRKALIRRKGAVRTVRTEVKRYGGEISGIKAGVTKSVKFRT